MLLVALSMAAQHSSSLQSVTLHSGSNELCQARSMVGATVSGTEWASPSKAAQSRQTEASKLACIHSQAWHTRVTLIAGKT